MEGKSHHDKKLPALDRRPATDADYEFARLTHHAAYKDVVTRQFGSFEEKEQDIYFDKAWKQVNHEIIEVAGESVGYCSLEDRGYEIFIGAIVIHPHFQGRGLGTALIQHVIEEAKQRDIPVRLQVFKKNAAFELYKRLGFEVIVEQDVRYIMRYFNK